MKVFSNEKLIKRNHTLGNIFSITSLGVLAIGMYFSFKDQSTNAAFSMIITYSCLIGGFLLFQIGNYFVNRWGKSPRPDEYLTQSLKGLDDKYSLYHYATPISHLLVGPAGVIPLLPFGQNGTLKYDAKKNTWHQKGGNVFLKIFGQEGLGRPISEANYTNEEADKFLNKLGSNRPEIKSNSLLVFTNAKADIDGEGSPVPFVTSEKLKDYIRKKAKENNFNAESINLLIESNLKI
jgi:hypothetical protein